MPAIKSHEITWRATKVWTVEDTPMTAFHDQTKLRRALLND